MKNKWSNYALKDGKVKESYIREYSNRSPKREAAKASGRDCIQQSGKIQEEIRTENERIREENIVETYQQGQQGIQVPVERRSTIEEENISQTQGEEMKKEKESPKAHKKHEAKESQSYEKKEDKKEKAKKK
jgi:hypothetical protein